MTLLISIWSNYEMKRPQVVASLELDTDKNSVELIVHYYGNKPAYNLRFASFSNGIVMSEFRDLVCSSFVRKGIPVLIPGARRFTIVAAGAGMQKLANERATVQLVYEEKLPLGLDAEFARNSCWIMSHFRERYIRAARQICQGGLLKR